MKKPILFCILTISAILPLSGQAFFFDDDKRSYRLYNTDQNFEFSTLENLLEKQYPPKLAEASITSFRPSWNPFLHLHPGYRLYHLEFEASANRHPAKFQCLMHYHLEFTRNFRIDCQSDNLSFKNFFFTPQELGVELVEHPEFYWR